ncbi:polyphosphate kinase [Yersinia rochesterensis]|uniref:polyphosphate kinase n=1 Tax=Yersinia rochesterensis TaxID=1604335 RepID=UPI0004F6B787|nr:polyphosphate kinase [Yersinia rochesterensis]AIN20091.1 hypothetical protein DJ57_2600 [Yersinia rochesterensis]CRY63167.1 Uncharacterised protein [Yersinia kristensenii]
MLSKDKLKYPTEITDKQLRYLITAFENNMTQFYPVGREAEIARQLLSLREQNLSLSRQLNVMTAAAQALRDDMRKGDAKLAELAALPPVAWRWRFCGQDVVTTDKDRAVQSNEMGVDDFTELFTAAKPSGLVTLPAPANYEDYGPMISLEKTMAALSLCGIEYAVRK